MKAIFCGFFFINCVNAQDLQKDIQVLEEEYNSKTFKKEDELSILKELTQRLKNPDKILKYSIILIDKAILVDSTDYLFDANLQKGNAYLLKSDFSKALESYLSATDIANKADDKINLALTNITIGGVYSEMGNHDNSIKYYEKSIEQLRELISIKKENIKNNIEDDYILQQLEKFLSNALLNSGDEYFNAGEYEKALGKFYESSSLCEKINYKIGSAYNLGNIGMVYAKQNKPELAEANMNAAIRILEKEKDYYPISIYLGYISDIYMELNLPELAKTNAQRSLKLAKKYQLKEEISNANKALSKIYEANNIVDSSLFHLKEYVKYQDILNTSLSESSRMASRFEVSKKQDELDLLKENEKIKRKNERILNYSFLGGFVLLSGLAFGLYRRNKYISKTKKIINGEKEKSDRLLLNILPKETAEELKKYGKVEAKKYESVTVLFTDFKSFTKLAENSSPEKLVESVDMYFSEFDRITAKYKLEKIKTIGDSYMCAGGLPEQTDNHADLMAQAALDILEFVNKSKQVHAVSDIRFEIRIGIHTGPVVAGVVGKNKFSYDIWGDTVNVASRIESSCEAGKISVSEDTYQLIKDKFDFESRGEIPIKNRSPINLYYLNKK
jgi:class 3 adenylate cyclase